MRTKSTLLLTATSIAALAAFGCTRGPGGVARAPVHPDASQAAETTTKAEPRQLDENDRKQPVYNAQKGFELNLPPPDVSGDKRAVTSDVGKPRWRNSSGTFIEDPARYPVRPRIVPRGGGPRSDQDQTDEQSEGVQQTPESDLGIQQLQDKKLEHRDELEQDVNPGTSEVPAP